MSTISLMTDGCTLRATESFLTVTVHYISPQWEMRSHVLQTRPVYEQHTSTNLAEHLKEAVNEWKLERPGTIIPVTTDNAKIIVNAIKETGLGPQIGCFAHTINLASQKATCINQISRLLVKVRKIATFFHKSTTAAHILESKQEMLNIPKHALIHDVPIYTLNAEEVATAEEMREVSKPLKTITTLMSTETRTSVSIIIPLTTTVLHSMAPKLADYPTVREVKLAITKNLRERYFVCYDFLHKCTALEPR